MGIDFLKSLLSVLEDIQRCGKEYNVNKINNVSPQYSKAIYNKLKEEDVGTFCMGGSIIIKPNGKLEMLLEKTKSELAMQLQAEKDHKFNRVKDYTTIGISVIALLVSILSLIISCSK